nr:hypothetical protein T05H4.8 - Caenorhabditis elegans [Caenorhabditis elegans]
MKNKLFVTLYNISYIFEKIQKKFLDQIFSWGNCGSIKKQKSNRRTRSPLDHRSDDFALPPLHTTFSDENFQTHRGLPPKQITDSESLRCQLSHNTFTFTRSHHLVNSGKHLKRPSIRRRATESRHFN